MIKNLDEKKGESESDISIANQSDASIYDSIEKRLDKVYSC